ncbi:MAG: hypothetical protein F6K54_39670 [Okeania sp. SIO3B5]|nr:element excision factor XisH family protein [Okeania sp. SIO3B5]NEO58637.1 hypothetical protein [Okeania sp. SIO3B5]
MAKDIYHQIVKTGLVKDGWTITDQKIRSQASCPFKGMKKNKV